MESEWNSLISPNFEFETPHIVPVNTTTKKKNDLKNIMQVEDTKKFYAEPFFLINHSLEHDFYKHETDEQVKSNWIAFNHEMTDSYKKKKRQADRSLKRIKKLRK